ncbi:MAG: hypothetical protein ACSHWQ_06345, partial [Spongiibacteraceae bacterium]
HSLFSLTRKSVSHWVSELPRANLGETTKQVYSALTELNRVNCKPKERYEVLELLRPEVHHAIEGLSKNYLNQTVILSEKAKKIAQLADVLCQQLTISYCKCFADFSSLMRIQQSSELMAYCLHRAMAGYAYRLLLGYQLSKPPAKNYWLELHELFRHAKTKDLLNKEVKDDIFGASTLTQVYLRSCMLARSKPHQLPQNLIPAVFTALGDWTAFISIRDNIADSSIFVLNLYADEPPIYRELYEKSPAGLFLSIDVSKLSAHQGMSLNAEDLQQKTTANQLSSSLLSQLAISWTAATDRSNARMPCNENASVVVGINAAHFYVAGEIDFERFDNSSLTDPSDTAFSEVRQKKDIWGQRGVDEGYSDDAPSITEKGISVSKQYSTDIEVIDYVTQSATASHAQKSRSYDQLDVKILDTSENGFRIEWPKTNSAKIRNGELLAIKSASSEQWLVAATRWIRSEQHHQLGLEILAPTATAYSAFRISSGQVAPQAQRALLLPVSDNTDSKLAIFPALSKMKVGNTVQLVRAGQLIKVALKEEVEVSSSFALFKVREIAPPPAKEKQKPDASDEGGLDQVWSFL